VLAAVLGVLVFDFFFVPPYLTLVVADTEYLFTFLALLMIGLVISNWRRVPGACRGHPLGASGTRRRCTHSAVTWPLAATWIGGAGRGDKRQPDAGSRVAVLLPGANGEPGLRLYTPGPGATLGDHEMAVATWAFEHGQPAGRGTDTLPGASLRYLPLSTARGKVGVLGSGRQRRAAT